MIKLYSYPHRGYPRGQDLLLEIEIADKLAAYHSYNEWEKWLDAIGEQEGVKLSSLIVSDKGVTKLQCRYHLPKEPMYGIALHLKERIEQAEIGISRTQERIRSIAEMVRYELVDFATMQSRVDHAFNILRARGHLASAPEVQLMASGDYGIWVNNRIPSSPRPERTATSAQDLTLKYGPTCWWTVKQVEEFARDPEHSELYAIAMKNMGFRPHEKIAGKWVHDKPKRH